MGLFDAIRDKAAELMGGAEEKVSELAGTELPNTDALAEQAQGVGDTAQGYVDGATGAVQDVAGGLPEVPNPDTFDPRNL